MNRRSSPAFLILVLWYSFASAAQQHPTAFLHANVIPMDRERVLHDQTVIIQGDKIAELGPSSSIQIPKAAHIIDATGKYLIPGLTDAHVHLYSTIEFPLYLANGVTAVFNLDGRPAHLLWRKQVAAGELLGPTIFTAGPLFGRAHTADEAVRLVDQQAEAGYDAIKIYNPVSKEEYPALIAEAKRRHLLLMGHIARAVDFDLTIHSGQSIAHLDEFLYTYFNPQHDDNNSHIVFDEMKIPAVAQETAKSGVYVIPTLSAYATTVQQTANLGIFLRNPALRYLSPWALEQFQPSVNRFKADSSPQQISRMQSALAFQRKLVKALSDAGVALMAGTDAPDVGPMAGFGIHDELQEVVNDGLTPYQALQMATINPARYFGKLNEFGSIEIGKRADFILLDGNPLGDISRTRVIAGVMVRGKWIPNKELTSLVEEIPAAYQSELRLVEAKLTSSPAEGEEYLADHDPLRTLGIAAVTELFHSQGLQKFHQFVAEVRRKNTKTRLVSEAGINTFGYVLLNENKFPDAIAILRMNTEDFPASANCFDSLAEALAKSGDIVLARAAYNKALAIDQHYPNAAYALKFLAEHPEK